MSGGKGLNYIRLTLTVLSISLLSPPVRAQCKALFATVPVPGSIADAGGSCTTAALFALGNGTVVDRANHLLWSEVAHVVPSAYTFQDFVSFCSSLVLGGRGGWYLPDVAQLQTLLPPGTCHSVMQHCGTAEDGYNGIVWANSGVSPYSYYCPAGFGCHHHMWAVATGLGEYFGTLQNVPPPNNQRKRVDALDVTLSNAVRCVASGLKLAITPDAVKIPAGSTVSGGKVLTRSRQVLTLTDYVGPASGVQLTLRSNRPTLDTIVGPTAATGTDGRATADVSTRNQTGQSTIDSTTPLVWTDPKGVVTWLPATYETTFHTTCYRTNLESDFTGDFIDTHKFSWCFLPRAGRTYRRSFMQDIKVQGSGVSVQSEVVQYNSGDRCYYYSDCPLTATGACAQVGVTAAVDPSVVPLRSTININSLGTRAAQDTGGAIQGYDIDIYNGLGSSVCVGWPNSNLAVTFVGY